MQILRNIVIFFCLIGLDAALGKDDWGGYFRIGESFGS